METPHRPAQRISASETDAPFLRPERDASNTTAEWKRHPSSALLSSILESSTEFGIWVTDAELRVVLFNRTTEEMFEVPASRVLGRTLDELARKAQRVGGVLPSDTTESLTSKDRLTFDYEFPSKSGRLRIVHMVVVPMRDGSGVFHGYAGFSRDVTRQREVERERTELEAHLRVSQRLEAVARLTAGICHDFNNSLTVILGYNELVLEGLSELDPLREHALELSEAASQAASVTRRLLAYGRSDSLGFRVFDLKELVLRARSMLERVIGEDIELESKLASGRLPVRADPDQLQQVLLNLAINARDAMPEGGRLCIETGRSASPGVASAILSITDSGVGMDSETQQRIFDPFFTTKQRGQGTGLGLYCAYGIVRQSGGRINVRSRPGRGSRFEVSIPLVAEVVAREAEAPAVVRSVRPGGATVLLLEDNTAIRELVRQVLERRGYRVLAAKDGDEALVLSDAHPHEVDLLISDVVVPKRSGVEVARRLRVGRPGIRVLFITGYAERLAGLLEDFEGASALRKPFRPRELVAQVEQILLRPAADIGGPPAAC